MRPFPLTTLLTLALCGLALTACGKRGDPLPPLRRTPQAVTEIALAQRGAELEIRLQAPRATTEGDRLGVVTLELLQATGAGDFAKLATRSEVKAAPGERMVVRQPWPAPGTLLRVAVIARSNNRASTQSPPRTLQVSDPVPAPHGLMAEMQADGVHLGFVAPEPMPAWIEPPKPSPIPKTTKGQGQGAFPAAPAVAARSPEVAAATPSPEDVGGEGSDLATVGEDAPAPQAPAAPEPAPGKSGFRIYRRGEPGSYAAPLGEELLTQAAQLDAEAPMGTRVCYQVRTVVSGDPLIESEASNEACLQVEDKQAPAAPTGVATLATPDGLEISWSPSLESDLVAYRVYKLLRGGAPERLFDVKPPQTSGVDVEAGPRVLYFVTAVDAAGNESRPSASVEGRR